MRCSQAVLLIEQEIRGKIPKEQKRKMAKHLAVCPDCVSYQLLRREMLSVLDQLTGREK